MTSEPDPVITLLTDYGLSDIYAGVLHGVIARICPVARVIDVTHDVPAGSVLAGALALADALPYLPAAIHVAVVDPGVGGRRRALALATEDGHILIGPDNGLLTLAAEAAGGVHAAFEISESPWRLDPVSATFHGRDVFAPVAAELARGRPLSAAGEAIDPESLSGLALPVAMVSAGCLEAAVTTIDSFGNLALFATPDEAEQAGIEPAGRFTVHGIAGRYGNSFADVRPGELLLHRDSTGRLALAVNGGSAAGLIGSAAGLTVRIHG